MAKYLCGVLLWVATCSISFANCDLTEFRWVCEIPAAAQPVRGLRSVIDCNGTNVYVTRSQYEEIMRYQRANVVMTLKVNGEFVTSPCVPAQF